MNNYNYQERLLKSIPGGAHTYSRGYDQFPSNAPEILRAGKGAYTFDASGNKFLDYGMALRAVHLGYANDDIDNAAITQIKLGNNLTRPSLVELEAAERIIELIDSVDMVKFTKNGSTSTTAAVKLARAYTQKELVIRCKDHPFFSYDDWFISSTELTKGIPKDVLFKTKTFNYNDINGLKALLEEFDGNIACLIMEASTVEHPKQGFLEEVQKLCNENGVVFILDEMITGFRWHIKGAQYYYGIMPDLCTFGKAMGNGFSIAAIAGKREIMELGSIEFEGRERVFLLSTTHGAEMSPLAAFIETMNFMEKNNVVEHLWSYGKKLISLINTIAKEYEVDNSLFAGGVECSPVYYTFDQNKNISLELKTLFMQEMIKNGVLMPWIALSYSHSDRELELTERALRKTLEVYRKAYVNGVDNYLDGDVVKPVFRRYN